MTDHHRLRSLWLGVSITGGVPMPVYAWDTDDCRCVRDRAYATTFLFAMAMNLKLLLKIKFINSNNIHRLTIKINAKRKIRISHILSPVKEE